MPIGVHFDYCLWRTLQHLSPFAHALRPWVSSCRHAAFLQVCLQSPVVFSAGTDLELHAALGAAEHLPAGEDCMVSDVPSSSARQELAIVVPGTRSAIAYDQAARDR